MEISRNCWGVGWSIGFKLQGNCTCCRAKVTNNLSIYSRPMDLASFPAHCWESSHSSSVPALSIWEIPRKFWSRMTCVTADSSVLAPWETPALVQSQTGWRLRASRRHWAARRKDVLLRESAQIWWSGSWRRLKERLQTVWATWVGLQQLWRSQPSLDWCSVHFPKKSALILFLFNQ